MNSIQPTWPTFRLRNRNLIYFTAALAMFLLTGCSDDHDEISDQEEVSVVLVQGAPLVGSANGMFFDQEDVIFVGNVAGQTITKLDPETGEILGKLGRADGVTFGADDLTFDSFGTLYWTEPIIGSVIGRTQAGETFTVAEGFPNANPITVSDDGRPFFAQCFGTGSNGIFQADPMGVIAPTTIRDEDPNCSSNGMDWHNGKLFAPRWFEGRVVSVNVDTGELSDITTNWGTPAAVKFNSLGELHAVNQGNGEVVRIDIETGEREILATFPENWLDNLAFDSKDRLFVSSAADGTVAEVLENGEIREVSPGGMILPMGLTLVNDTLFTTEFSAVLGFNIQSGTQVDGFSWTYGFGPINNPTNVSAIDDDLVLMSMGSNELLIWDLEAEREVVKTSFVAPVDAEPFRGDLLVTEFPLGRVVRAVMPDLTERETIAQGLGFPAGLAVHNEDVYVSDSAQGKVFRIISEGEILSEPEEVAADLESPEGITINNEGTKLLVVEGGVSRVTQIDLASGERVVIATDLNFQPVAIPALVTHFINDVEMDDSGAIYVNSDGGNIIYKFPP